MENSRSSEEIEEEPDVMEWFDRKSVVKAFDKIGFFRDYETRFVLVLRNSTFPFQRIVLPSQEKIHIELLKLYAQDLGIPLPRLINLLKLFPKERSANLMDGNHEEGLNQNNDMNQKEESISPNDVITDENLADQTEDVSQMEDVTQKEDTNLNDIGNRKKDADLNKIGSDMEDADQDEEINRKEDAIYEENPSQKKDSNLNNAGVRKENNNGKKVGSRKKDLTRKMEVTLKEEASLKDVGNQKEEEEQQEDIDKKENANQKKVGSRKKAAKRKTAKTRHKNAQRKESPGKDKNKKEEEKTSLKEVANREKAAEQTEDEVIQSEVVNQKKLEDHRLINLARQGDQKAFESLLNKYRNLVYHVMIKMVGVSQEAEDLTQEAFIKAFNALATFNEEFAFSTWLMKIATNNCIDYLRKKRLKVFSINEPIQYKDEELQYEIPDKELTADRKMLAEERSNFINNAIQSLPPRYRHVILLRHKEEKSYEEISEILNLPLGTVKARIFRAREMLNKKIRNLD